MVAERLRWANSAEKGSYEKISALDWWVSCYTVIFVRHLLSRTRTYYGTESLFRTELNFVRLCHGDDSVMLVLRHWVTSHNFSIQPVKDPREMICKRRDMFWRPESQSGRQVLCRNRPAMIFSWESYPVTMIDQTHLSCRPRPVRVRTLVHGDNLFVRGLFFEKHLVSFFFR